jgi:hypothetical protein
VSRSGVEAALAFAFFRGGILLVFGGGREGEWSEETRKSRSCRYGDGRRKGPRRAESPKPRRVIPLTIHYSTSAAMDARDSIHDVFSTDHLWRQPSFFDDADAQESSLFAPLELDSGSSRLFNRECERVVDQL